MASNNTFCRANETSPFCCAAHLAIACCSHFRKTKAEPEPMKAELGTGNNDPVMLDLFDNLKRQQDEIQKSLDEERTEVIDKFEEKLQKLAKGSVVDSLCGIEFNKLANENNDRIAEMNKELEKLKTSQNEELDDASKHFKEFYQKHSKRRVEDIKNQNALRLNAMKEKLFMLKRTKRECQQLVDHANCVIRMNMNQAAQIYEDLTKELKACHVELHERTQARHFFSDKCNALMEKFTMLSEDSLAVADNFQTLLTLREVHNKQLEVAQLEAFVGAQNHVTKSNTDMRSELRQMEGKVFSDILCGAHKDETSLQQTMNEEAVKQTAQQNEMKQNAQASASLVAQEASSFLAQNG